MISFMGVIGRNPRSCGMAPLGGRGFFHTPVSGILALFRPTAKGGPMIRECELTAAAMAIMSWARGGIRNVVLRTDNQNVLRWVANAQSHSPVASRIIRDIVLLFLRNQVDILPVYVGSAHNLFAEGLTRRAQYGIDEWASQEGVGEIYATSQLWAGMALSYKPDVGAEPRQTQLLYWDASFAFFRSYDYRAYEWRPSHYAVECVMGNWGVPVFRDQVLDSGVYDMLVRRVSPPISVLGDADIFLLAVYCATWAEIRDFRRASAFRSIRYAAMGVPFWLRGGAESALWTSATSLDTALTGGPWAASWVVYAEGWIQSRQFDLRLANAEIRTLQDCYRLVGQHRMEDPEGIMQTRSIPNTVGEVTVITPAWVTRYSRHSHLPPFGVDSIHGFSIAWP